MDNAPGLRELADDARLSTTVDATNIVANQHPYSGLATQKFTHLLKGNVSPASVVVFGVKARECPRQEQEKGSASSVKIVCPLEDVLSPSLCRHVGPSFPAEIPLHDLNVQISRVIILAKYTV